MQIEDEDKKPMKNKRQMKRKTLFGLALALLLASCQHALVLNVLNNSGYDLKVMSYDAAGGLQQYLIQKGISHEVGLTNKARRRVLKVAFGSTRASRN